MKIQPVSAREKKQTRQGMTLIEVIVAAAILAILAIMASTAFFYPRLLVVNSGLEQSAIHAGIAEIEWHLYNHTDAVELGIFNTDGWDIDDADITSRVRTNYAFQNPDKGKYLVISNSIFFRDGEPPVELITYRSLEVSRDKR